MTKVVSIIFLNTVPVIIMIGLIPFVQNDFLLTLLYILIILISFAVRYEQHEYVFIVFGFTVITVSELFFVSTGAEVFRRASLFGSIPLWLPFLWAYAFVAIKRSVAVLDTYFKS